MELDPYINSPQQYKEVYGNTWLKQFNKDKKLRNGTTSLKQLYYKEVQSFTENNKHLIKDIHLRGYKAYHIDHKIPISLGYLHSIPPEVISHPSNLTMLWWEDNVAKRATCTIDCDNKWIQEAYLESILITK